MSLWNKSFKVMLLKEVDKPFNSKDYIYEIKYDGIRSCIFVNNKSIKIISRNNHDLTNIYPELKSIKSLVTKNTILDGEIILMDNNKISFSKLLERNLLKNKEKIDYYAKNNPVTFILFDILYLDKDLTHLPLLKRKKLLEKIPENDVLIKSRIYTDGIKLFKEIKKRDMEGIIAKRIDSKYEINTRTNNWLKIKNYKNEVFFIGGYKLMKNNYISLLLGEYKDEDFLFVGKISITKNNKIYEKVLNQKAIKKSPFSNYKNNEVFIKPTLSCKVKYIARTLNNELREPVIIKDL